MSSVPNSIGPLSVRYAAQIRELLYTQAVERMAADEEAARAAAKAEKAARLEQPVREVEEPVKVDIETKDLPPPVVLPEPADEPVAPAQIVDIQA